MVQAIEHKSTDSDVVRFTDPVCHMTVKPESAAASLEYQGKTYYFCNVNCLKKFREDPERFLKPDPQKTAIHPVSASAAASEFTCPMHPQIIRDVPGFCPICGMALEPRVLVGDEENVELIDMKRRFWI